MIVHASVSGPDVATSRPVRVESVASMRSQPVVAPPGELVPEQDAQEPETPEADDTDLGTRKDG